MFTRIGVFGNTPSISKTELLKPVSRAGEPIDSQRPRREAVQANGGCLVTRIDGLWKIPSLLMALTLVLAGMQMPGQWLSTLLSPTATGSGKRALRQSNDMTHRPAVRTHWIVASENGKRSLRMRWETSDIL